MDAIILIAAQEWAIGMLLLAITEPTIIASRKVQLPP